MLLLPVLFALLVELRTINLASLLSCIRVILLKIPIQAVVGARHLLKVAVLLLSLMVQFDRVAVGSQPRFCKDFF